MRESLYIVSMLPSGQKASTVAGIAKTLEDEGYGLHYHCSCTTLLIQHPCKFMHLLLEQQLENILEIREAGFNYL